MTTLIILAVVIWAGALLLKWYRPTLIGRSGENFVSGKLFELGPKYKVLDNLMLPSNGNMNTTQIDHVVISNFGIFVIETKSYSGWIFGNAHQQHWTQVIYRFKKKFYNPLRQNFAHIKAVEALVRPAYPTVPIIGFVVFPSAEKLQVSGTDVVGQAGDIIRKIQNYTSPVLSDSEKETVVDVLLGANILDKQARKLHNRTASALKSSKGF